MYLQYLDDSGSPNNNSFVLGGFAVFEGEVRNHTDSIDAIMEKHFPGKGRETELHISELRKAAWDDNNESFTKEQFFALIEDVSTHVASQANRRGIKLFGTVVHKPSLDAGEDPYEKAFEDVVKRFDSYLVGEHKSGNTHKGIVIIDRENTQRTNQLRNIFEEFRTEGTQWGRIHNLPEVPLFASSAASRMLQLADFVAHYTFRRYETGHATHFDKMLPVFHQVDGVFHGFGHIINPDQNCMCAPCAARGAWRAHRQIRMFGDSN